MTPDQATTPYRYAASIARYISAPSTIRARTIDAWGRAPSHDDCAKLRAEAMQENAAYQRLCEARATPDRDRHIVDLESYQCGHERSMENTAHKGDKEVCRECLDARRSRIVRRLRVEQSNMLIDSLEPVVPPTRHEDTIPLTLISSRRVMVLASKLFDIPAEHITGKTRDRAAVRARWAIMYTLRITMGWSFPDVARFVGLNDHTTALYAAKQSSLLIESNPWFAGVCARLSAIALADAPKVSSDLVDLLMREAV